MSEFDTHEYPPEEELETDEETAPVSPETGTVYGQEGQAEVTPHDQESEDEDGE